MRIGILAPCQSTRLYHRSSRSVQKSSATPERQHLSICLNKTCKKQGSQQIAKFVEDLSLPSLEVDRTGCLGKCGAGPNVVLSPLNVELSHVKTVSKMTQILREVGGYDISDGLLKMTTLRLQGNALARQGEFEEAIQTYDEALQLKVPDGRHLVLSNKAGVLLQLGKAKEALKSAEEAALSCPLDFHNATFRQVEAHIALGNPSAAKTILDSALQTSPDLRHHEHFQQLKLEL